MKRLALAAILLGALPLPLQANQWASGGHVVHNRRAPVILHRLVPPFYGVHVYESPRAAHDHYGQAPSRGRRR
jgi:hypothetical protein